jgi:hypothetical protein
LISKKENQKEQGQLGGHTFKKKKGAQKENWLDQTHQKQTICHITGRKPQLAEPFAFWTEVQDALKVIVVFFFTTLGLRMARGFER